MTKPKRYVYSVRRARQILLSAIRAEVSSAVQAATGQMQYTARSTCIYAREAAIRDLIASVRKEAK